MAVGPHDIRKRRTRCQQCSQRHLKASNGTSPDNQTPTDRLSVAEAGHANNARSEETSVTGAVVSTTAHPSSSTLTIMPVAMVLNAVD